MTFRRKSVLPTLIVLITGVLWGVYWIPVRALADAGLAGAWGTFAITVAASVLLVPIAARDGFVPIRTNLGATVAMMIGGVAFVLYSVGFNFGRVAMVTVLFYLTPVWSVLISRYLLGWQTPILRLLAIAVGVVGLAIMLAGDGSVPLPQGVGEWMALASGLCWSIATTMMRTNDPLPPVTATATFAIGAALAAGVSAPLLSPLPQVAEFGSIFNALAMVFGTAVMWWCLSLAIFLWAAPQLDPARVGILLMAEVIVGAATAAVLAGEPLGVFEIVGGLLVLAAGVLEVWPFKAKPAQVA
ncbi:MAG: DMT family transporter [Pseudomonadota bacterium]